MESEEKVGVGVSAFLRTNEHLPQTRLKTSTVKCEFVRVTH